MRINEKISKDEALENAIKTSSGFHALFMGSKGKAVAKALVTTNEIYHRPIRVEWEETILVHEIVHLRSSLKTGNIKILWTAPN